MQCRQLPLLEKNSMEYIQSKIKKNVLSLISKWKWVFIKNSLGLTELQQEAKTQGPPAEVALTASDEGSTASLCRGGCCLLLERGTHKCSTPFLSRHQQLLFQPLSAVDAETSIHTVWRAEPFPRSWALRQDPAGLHAAAGAAWPLRAVSVPKSHWWSIKCMALYP